MNDSGKWVYFKDGKPLTGCVIREHPQFIRRTRDQMILVSLPLFEAVLDAYKFSTQKMIKVSKGGGEIHGHIWHLKAGCSAQEHSP